MPDFLKEYIYVICVFATDPWEIIEKDKLVSTGVVGFFFFSSSSLELLCRAVYWASLDLADCV